jgi:hypothetical protein
MVPILKDGSDNWTEITSGTGLPIPSTIPSKSSASAMTAATNFEFPQVKFSHIQIYADSLDDLEVYKKLEQDLCEFAAVLELQQNKDNIYQQEKRQLWQSIVSQGSGEREFEEFIPQNRDVIKQLMVGFGMRVTAAHRGCGTKSFLVTTKDHGGVQIVVTTKDSSDEAPCGDADGHGIHHFEAGM